MDDFKERFISWLKLQKNSKNRNYSDGAINIIVKTYEKCLISMDIKDIPCIDIFDYRTLEDFMFVYPKIVNNPLYNLKARNGGDFYTEHSNYIELYKKYLEENNL